MPPNGIATDLKSMVDGTFALLAALIGPRPADTEISDRSAFQGADWNRILRLAERHRVVPALAHAVVEKNIQMPGAVAAALATAARAAAFEEMALAATTSEIVSLFGGDGTGVTVLKGVPLSLTIHGRLGLRTSRDIDLLVAPVGVPRALQRLREMGFHPRGSIDDPAALAALMRRRKDIELLNDSRRQIVELHWRLFDNPHLLPLDSAFVTVPVKLPTGQECAVLPLRFNLLYLANHGAQHGWSRLKWLIDFAALLAPLGEQGIADFYDGVTVADGRRSVAQALLLCEALFSWPLPVAVKRDNARDFRIRMLSRIALSTLTRGGDSEIEALPFGSTPKNISHYLIRSSPRYLLNEMLFDLTDVSGMRSDSRWRRFGALGRLASWTTRRVSFH